MTPSSSRPADESTPPSPTRGDGAPTGPPPGALPGPGTGTTAGTTAEPTAETAQTSSSRWGFVVTVLCDIVLPVGLYYLLRHLGYGEVTSLLLSGSAPALHTVYLGVRHRRLDAIGMFTVVLLIVSAGAALLTTDPRIVLARNGVFTAFAGLWLLVTLFMARPFTYQALKALLPGRAARLERLWETDRAFRRVWRLLTVVWGAGLLVDAVLRVVMAYSLPVDDVPALDGVLYAATWLSLQVVTQITLYRSGTLRKIFGDSLRPFGKKL